MVGNLPYIEQNNLFANYKDFGWMGPPDTPEGRRYGHADNQPVTKKQVPTYTCPSDTVQATSSIYGGITFHNYVGNFGNTAKNRVATLGTNSSGGPNKFAGAAFIHLANKNAALQVMRLQDMMDGLSNTLLFSETVQGANGDLRGFAWWHGGAHFETYLAPNSSEPDMVEAAYACKPGVPNPPCATATSALPECIAARSRHPGGVQVALCDGSGRFVSESINIDVWRFSSTAYGKEPNKNF